MQYLEDTIPQPKVAQCDPYRRAVENMVVSLADPLINAGYTLIFKSRSKSQGFTLYKGCRTIR
jgi:hypothetical protein